MSLPVLHDLEFVRKAFPQIQLPDSWEISTAKSDDVIWNIVLAYLTSFPPSDNNELRERQKRLTGLQEVTQFRIFNQSFNPFLYRYDCISGESMSNLVAKFRETVENYVRKDEKLYRNPAKNFAYLEASSNMLSCNIVLVSSRCQNEFLVNVFPVETTGHPRRYYQNVVSIFNKPKIMSSNKTRQDQFTFGMPKDIGLDKKRLALKEIFIRTKIIHNPIEIISKICALPGITANFLISLIENKFVHVVHSLYGHPDILSKLSAAGFETDPRAKDSSGKSAFYHVLKAEDSPLVFLLYDHAANNSFKIGSRTFVENLLSLQEDFTLLKKDMESEEIGVKSRSLFEDLCLFNEFHIDIYRSINNIRIKYDDQICSEYEALQRKEILCTLLKFGDTIYDDMHRKIRRSADECCFLKSDDRMEYCDKLDTTLAVTFFDNLFLLQERRLIPNNAFLDVQSDYLVFVSLRAFFKQNRNNKLFLSVFPCVRFHERLSLQRRLCSFKEILDEQKLSEYDTGHVPTLSHLPQIYDNFLLFRIQYYLKAATRIDVWGPKPVLVIIRCLQVLEESVKETDFNCVQRYLSLALPGNLIKNLKKTSNKLPEFNFRELQCVNNLQEDEKLFKEIQRDLINLGHFLFPIFLFHQYEIKRFFLLDSMKLTDEKQQLIPRCHCSQKYREILEDEINNLNLNKPTVALETGGYFMCIVLNMGFAIREVLKTLKTPINEKEIEKLDSYFLCLESILRHLFKDEDLKEYLGILNRRKSTFVVMRLKSVVYSTNLPEENEAITKHRPSDIPYSRHRLKDTIANREIIAQAHAGLETSEEILKIIKLKKVSGSTSPDAIHKKEHEEVSGHSKIFEILQTALIGKVDSSGTTPSDHDKKVEAPAEIAEVKAKTDIEIVQQFVDEYVEIALKRRIKPKENFSFKNIEAYAIRLEGKTYLKHSMMQKIRDFGSDFSLRAEDFEETERWKSYQTIDEPQKPAKGGFEDKPSLLNVGGSAEHKMAIRRKEIIKKESDSLDKNLGIPSPTEKIVLKSEEAEYLEMLTKQKISFQNRKIKNHRFGFFRNRIKMLKDILISSDKATHQLWEKATTFREKLQLKNKIVKLYLEDYTIQISVEMLLFDFMNVLRSKELKQLWRKTTNLLGGINLRRVLASDNSIPTWDREPSSRFLEPFDLASELVEKMLKLLSDEPVIDCIQKILEQTGNEFSNFMQIMDDTRNEEFKSMREEILECDNWEEYALLIAS